MIASLRGQVSTVLADSCIIDVHGVGYQVHMPVSALESLRKQAGEAFIHTYQYVREDTLALYGFLSAEDKSLFVQVIGVSGIGPKTALALLSVLPAERFRDTVRREDTRTLASVPGIGLKTAQRLVLELKSKIGKIPGSGGTTSESIPASGGLFNDAVDALLALGYPMTEAVAAVEAAIAQSPDATTGDTVRNALKRLAKK